MIMIKMIVASNLIKKNRSLLIAKIPYVVARTLRMRNRTNIWIYTTFFLPLKFHQKRLIKEKQTHTQYISITSHIEISKS